MDIRFNFKNFEPSDHLKEYANSRFKKLEKYIHKSDNAHLQVNLEVEKFRQIADVTLTVSEAKLSAQEETEDMYSTIDVVLDKIEAQVRKMRDKQKDKRKGKTSGNKTEEATPLFASGPETSAEAKIVPSNRYEPKPMDAEEAVIQLEKSDYGFLVFFNADNNRVNVVYRKNNGDYGLIDPRM